MIPLKEVSLFGGALHIGIPAEFEDVSSIREIPDNQEVYADAATDRSIIVEVLEMVECGDPDAARWHLHNLAEEMQALNEDLVEAMVIGPDFSSLAARDETICSIAFGRVAVAKYRDAAKIANVVNLFIACLRLKDVSTDLLVSMNDPSFINSESSSAKEGAVVSMDGNLEVKAAVFKRIISTLRIDDFTLFQA
eukprot:Plantae.Rhodophyta-Purpureofilum_apyrenoidigerum.ctg11456.p3 GENE.Plantae.Rhodophyta-Purpureofilum_apyrenoidigerum.ctg11456~~Plantae.Rhodophyta-Purpureofilum_apyrenoidigerum.ctg11456.p3  ORF type:complete len:194 (+),score=39.61 Plantae.Rhodophyta-Purpureofilum_apyrenoidigerum.ctg11456:1299-1880(+)